MYYIFYIWFWKGHNGGKVTDRRNMCLGSEREAQQEERV